MISKQHCAAKYHVGVTTLGIFCVIDKSAEVHLRALL